MCFIIKLLQSGTAEIKFRPGRWRRSDSGLADGRRSEAWQMTDGRFRAWQMAEVRFRPGRRRRSDSGLPDDGDQFQAWQMTEVRFRPGRWRRSDSGLADGGGQI